jgi:hypothetical protein
MAISGDYSSPVTVNGYSCRNCSEVDRAKRNIDPANPSAGPFGINDHSKAGKAGAAVTHSYDLVLTDPTGVETVYAYGAFIVQPGVTR